MTDALDPQDGRLTVVERDAGGDSARVAGCSDAACSRPMTRSPQVASGRAEAYWGPGLQPWDAAAGVLLVAEAGGTIGDLDGPTGRAWPDSGDVLAATAALRAPLRRLLTDALGHPSQGHLAAIVR